MFVFMIVLTLYNNKENKCSEKTEIPLLLWLYEIMSFWTAYKLSTFSGTETRIFSNKTLFFQVVLDIHGYFRIRSKLNGLK